MGDGGGEGRRGGGRSSDSQDSMFFSFFPFSPFLLIVVHRVLSAYLSCLRKEQEEEAIKDIFALEGKGKMEPNRSQD